MSSRCYPWATTLPPPPLLSRISASEFRTKTQESPQPVPFWWFEVYCHSHSSPSLCHAHTSIINRCRPVVLPTTVVQATTQNLCGINSCLRLMSRCKNSKSASDFSEKRAIIYAKHHPEHQLKTVSMSKNHLHTRTRHHFRGGRGREGDRGEEERGSPDGEGCVLHPLPPLPKRALLRASIHLAAWVPLKTLGPSRTTAVPPTWISPRPRATWYKRHHRLVTQQQAELEICLST